MPDGERPNILVIWGDDIGITNLSCYSDGLMGYRTPNIDRIADEGMRFTDSYGEQSCTAGRSSFITGQSVFRTGLSKVGVPARRRRPAGRGPDDRRAAQAARLRHRAVRQEPPRRPDEFLPTLHGFDEFFGNLYHLNAEEEPELAELPAGRGLPALPRALRAARRPALAGRRTRTTRPRSRAGAASAGSGSRTRAR